MPDETTGTQSGANDDAANGGTDGGSTESTATSTADDGELPEGAKKALAASRKAERDATRRASALEAKIKEFEDRDKSEAERAAEAKATAERERDEAKAEVAQIRREGWLTKAAVAAKFIDPDDAVAMLAREELEDEAAAKKAIADLAKSKPHLLGVREAGAGSFGGGQRGGSAGGKTTAADMDAEIRRMAGRG